MSSYELTAISQLCSGLISDKYKQLQKYTHILPIIITWLLTFMNSFAYKNYIIYAGIILYGLYYIYKSCSTIKVDKPGVQKMILYHTFEIRKLIGIISVNFIEFKQKKIEWIFLNNILYKNLNQVDNNNEIFMGTLIGYDKTVDLTLYIKSIINIESNMEGDEKYYGIEIVINNDNVDIKDYIKKLIGRFSATTSTCEKMFYINQKALTAFKCQKLKPADLKSKYWDTLFHSQKEFIWTKVYRYMVQFDTLIGRGYTPTANFMFYGPPGTGKTSMVYRIAKIFKLDIYKINLETINSIFDLECTLCKKDSIILLDEFDNALEQIEQNANQDDDENKYNNITIEHVLSAIQGPIPIENRIIIATTNHYDKLKDKYPAMFREGRLFPIYFGNFDETMLQEISMHYYGKKLVLRSKKNNISPSEIMANVVEKEFDEFQKWLDDKLEYKIDSI